MKKVFIRMIAVFALCSLCFSGCSNAKAPDQTEKGSEDMPKKLTAQQVTSLPVATDDMTSQEKRQLCLDFLELQLGFHWVPSVNVTDWITTNWKKGNYKKLLTENVYGGIPYQSVGTGNLYRWLEYYDETTGVMDMEKAFSENGGYGVNAAVFDVEKDETGKITYKKYRSFQTLFNQCSVSASWGWGRVINSANFGYTNGINAYNGFIPVGCYSYGFEHEGKTYGMTDIKIWGERDTDTEDKGNPIGYDTPHVVRDLRTAKGKNALFDCYAQMKPADCLVNKGHVMMVKEVNVLKNGKGEPNYQLSTVVCIEQIEDWGIEDEKLGDKRLWQQGGIDRVYSFETLQKKNYIPFTFLEFLDENDPQDKKHIDYYNSYADKLTAVQNKYKNLAVGDEAWGAAVEKAQTYTTVGKTEGAITMAEFTGMSVGANYYISDVFVTVTDSSGKELLKNIYRSTGTVNVREVSMLAGQSNWKTTEEGKRLDLTEGVYALAGQGNTIQIELQLSTGEKLTAFKGILEK